MSSRVMMVLAVLGIVLFFSPAAGAGDIRWLRLGTLWENEELVAAGLAEHGISALEYIPPPPGSNEFSGAWIFVTRPSKDFHGEQRIRFYDTGESGGGEPFEPWSPYMVPRELYENSAICRSFSQSYPVIQSLTYFYADFWDVSAGTLVMHTTCGDGYVPEGDSEWHIYLFDSSRRSPVVQAYENWPREGNEFFFRWPLYERGDSVPCGPVPGHPASVIFEHGVEAATLWEEYWGTTWDLITQGLPGREGHQYELANWAGEGDCWDWAMPYDPLIEDAKFYPLKLRWLGVAALAYTHDPSAPFVVISKPDDLGQQFVYVIAFTEQVYLPPFVYDGTKTPDLLK
jgi:hypothetical protein